MPILFSCGSRVIERNATSQDKTFHPGMTRQRLPLSSPKGWNTWDTNSVLSHVSVTARAGHQPSSLRMANPVIFSKMRWSGEVHSTARSMSLRARTPMTGLTQSWNWSGVISMIGYKVLLLMTELYLLITPLDTAPG